MTVNMIDDASFLRVTDYVVVATVAIASKSSITGYVIASSSSMSEFVFNITSLMPG